MSYNYNSWKVFKNINKYLLIKYEELILNDEKYFEKILLFIKNISKMDFDISEKKIKKVLEEIKFEKLKKLEKEKGFHESKKDDKGNTINFFRSGKTKQWKNNLDLKTKNMIEEVCQKEMKELGYI